LIRHSFMSNKLRSSRLAHNSTEPTISLKIP